MKLPTHLITAVLALAISSLAIMAQEADIELRQLTDDNFRASTARGMWLVEHYSPRCGHCRAFAPTWTKLARDKQHLERLAGFHMAQVNCLAQGDLCNSNGIKFYPQIVLYKDGQPTQYTGDRSYDNLSDFIEKSSSEYASTQLPMAPSDSDSVSTARTKPNPEGRVMEVDEAGLDTMIRQGPVLVDFFAPWCGHCKKLRPTYDQLASDLKDKINIIAVNCDDHRPLCVKHEVRAFPTIKLFDRGATTEYTGARSLDKLKAFASKAVKPTGLVPIKFDDFDQILRTDEAFFLYLQNFQTSISDLDSVKKTLEPLNIPAYTSVDPRLYSNLSIANPPPTSALLAFSSFSPRAVGLLAFPASQERLTKFINLHRHPTVINLTPGNFNEVFKSDARAIVVLGAINKGQQGKAEYAEFERVAKAWKRGGRDFTRPVWFAYVEAEKWAGWLKQSYGIRKANLPGVVVIDPPKNEYYDTTIEGAKIAFDGGSIFSVLEGFYQHFLRPKRSETALEWGSRSATMTLITTGQWVMDHPFLALFALTATVAIFVWLLQKCVSRDPREMGKGSAFGFGEKGNGRLD